MAVSRFDGKVVVVTGAAGALGSAIARAFGREGATVAVAVAVGVGVPGVGVGDGVPGVGVGTGPPFPRSYTSTKPTPVPLFTPASTAV